MSDVDALRRKADELMRRTIEARTFEERSRLINEATAWNDKATAAHDEEIDQRRQAREQAPLPDRNTGAD